MRIAVMSGTTCVQICAPLHAEKPIATSAVIAVVGIEKGTTVDVFFLIHLIVSCLLRTTTI